MGLLAIKLSEVFQLKYIMTILLTISMGLSLVACSANETSEPQNQTQKVVLFTSESDSVNAYELTVDFQNSNLSLAQEPIYTLSGTEMLGKERIQPQFMSSKTLILREKPANSTYNTDCVSQDRNTLYYEDYTLKLNPEDSTFVLYKGNESISEPISLTYDDMAVIPSSFFVDEEEKIAILGMTSTTSEEAEMVSLLYHKKDEKYEIKKKGKFSGIWQAYDLSKDLCLNSLADGTNVTVSAEGNFLYNETKTLFTISPYDGRVKNVLNEEKIAENMPFLDTQRDSYSFFSSFSSQSGSYIVTFPAFNATEGTYAAFYLHTGEYVGYLLCSNDEIILADKDNHEIAKIEGAFIPQLYVPTLE